MLPELTSPAMPTPLTQLTFARRAEPAELSELMDEPCAYSELRDCFRDFVEMNRITRGYTPTLGFLNRVALQHSGSRPLRILDVGCGGGDTLREIARWATDRDLAVELTGIDLNANATRAARELSARDSSAAQMNWITGDIFAYSPQAQTDVVLSALFVHHLSSCEIVRFLRWLEQHARVGWFINDLHRSSRAAFWFRFLPVLFGWHRFIQHDGPVSLRRAFVASDWEQFLAAADISDATIESHPMNRLCVSRIRPLL